MIGSIYLLFAEWGEGVITCRELRLGPDSRARLVLMLILREVESILNINVREWAEGKRTKEAVLWLKG